MMKNLGAFLAILFVFALQMVLVVGLPLLLAFALLRYLGAC